MNILVYISVMVAMAMARPGNPTLTCSEKHSQLTRFVENLAAENRHPPLGLEFPVCNEEGNYGPIQCSGSQCYCVAETTGVQISEGTVNRWEAENITCNCARDRHGYDMIGVTFRCTPSGEYEQVQCLGSVCFCADVNGDRRENSPTMNIWEKRILLC